MSDALPRLDALPPLPPKDAAKPVGQEPVIELDNLELPSGYRLDPEEYGIDVTFKPASVESTFATDLADDEPASLVELPAELRQFVNSEQAKELTPEQVKSLMAEVLKEHLPTVQAPPTAVAAPAGAGVIHGPPAVVRTPPRVLARRAVIIAWVLLFFFQWKLGLVFLVPTLLVWVLLALWKWERAASAEMDAHYKALSADKPWNRT